MIIIINCECCNCGAEINTYTDTESPDQPFCGNMCIDEYFSDTKTLERIRDIRINEILNV